VLSSRTGGKVILCCAKLKLNLTENWQIAYFEIYFSKLVLNFSNKNDSFSLAVSEWQ
jgi:hypothetical protein